MTQAVKEWNDGLVITGGTAGTAGPYPLIGGKYGIVVNADTWGSGGKVSVRIVGADGSTLVPVQADVTANNYGTIDLPPCEVSVVAGATVTNVGVVISAIPYKRV